MCFTLCTIIMQPSHFSGDELGKKFLYFGKYDILYSVHLYLHVPGALSSVFFH
jgi:hypothetical protein